MDEKQDDEEEPETEEEKYPGIEKLRLRLMDIFGSVYGAAIDIYDPMTRKEGIWSETLELREQISDLSDALVDYSKELTERVQELEASQPKLKPIRQEVEGFGHVFTELQEEILTMKEKLPKEFYSIPEFKQSIREGMQLLERQLTGRIASIDRHIIRLWIGIVTIPTIISIILGLVLKFLS